MGENNSLVHTSTNDAPRDSMVNIAMEFLQNPRVKNTPLSRQKEFLTKKGLSGEEIELAIQKSRIFDTGNASFPQPGSATDLNQVMLYRPSIWTRINRIGTAVVIIGIALYGLHKFYKLYIEPWLYGCQNGEDRLAQMETQLLEVNRSLSQLRKSISSIEESLGIQKNEFHKCINELNLNPENIVNPVIFMEMRSDITTIKSLLLNRHSFPEVPKLQPSIPLWQFPVDSSKKSENSETPVEDKDNTNKEEVVVESAEKNDTAVVENGICVNGEMDKVIEEVSLEDTSATPSENTPPDNCMNAEIA